MLFRSACTKAALVVANSQQLIDALCRRYAMEPDRAVCIPFAPSTYVKNSVSDDKSKDEAVLQKYYLPPGYLFYPAQFWPHKNHATLLAALDILRDRGQRMNLVLCGSDRGTRRRIEDLMAKYDVVSQVTLLGFVDSSELGALYRGSTALVMPSYFGPTNLPPLEAWAVGTPVIYPQAFKDQVEDAAVLFDYDDPQSLADAISSVSSPELCARLREAGEKRLQHFARQTDEGHSAFARHIKRLQHRLMLYSSDV
jgi:glycosyltransferase involved in cell wall biosynthesis